LESEQAVKSVDAAELTKRADPGRLEFRPGRTARSAGILGVLSVVLCAGGGCSGQSSFLTGGPTVGQLKTSLSHLEYENEQLKKSTAKLQRENRSMEDRLVQEQMENGDLTARLDDARNLLRDRGLDADVRVGSHRSRGALGKSTSESDGAENASFPDESPPRPRKTPFAQIPGGGDSLGPIDVKGPAADNDSSERSGTRPRRSRRRPDDELDQHSYHKAPQTWMPVADSSDDSLIQIR
jgi:hypothetical protein